MAFRWGLPAGALKFLIEINTFLSQFSSQRPPRPQKSRFGHHQEPSNILLDDLTGALLCAIINLLCEVSGQCLEVLDEELQALKNTILQRQVSNTSQTMEYEFYR